MKLKIGLITFHRAENAGAILQTYALQKTFQNKACDTEIIDVRTQSIDAPYKLIKLRGNTMASKVKSLIKSIVFLPCNVEKKIKYNDFRKHLTISSKYNCESLNELNGVYHTIVVGSDQVFNLDIVDKDIDIYTLKNILCEYKCTYAASFGRDFLNSSKDNCIIQELKKFKSISVREKGIMKDLENSLNRNIVTSIDPTLLLKRSDWDQVVMNNKHNNGEYIFLYSIANSDDIFAFTKTLADKLGVSAQCYSSSIIKPIQYKIKNNIAAGPEDFIRLIKNASFVVASSFHGVVFSLIYHKPFVCIMPTGNETIARISNLLDSVGIKDRLYDRIPNELNDFSPIDWDCVDTKIDEMRRESLAYIDTIINDLGEIQ